MKRAWFIPLLFLLILVVYGASIPSRYYIDGVLSIWHKTDTSLSVEFDSLALRNSMLQRLLDSSVGVTVREEIQYTGVAQFSNAASDSTTLQLWGQVYNGHILAYNVYLDRMVINSALPGSYGPSTWRDDLPIISTDSMLVYHIGRLASRPAGSRGFISAYKVALGTGLSAAVTTGTFYDMIIFNEALVFPAPPQGVQLNIQLSVKKRR